MNNSRCMNSLKQLTSNLGIHSEITMRHVCDGMKSALAFLEFNPDLIINPTTPLQKVPPNDIHQANCDRQGIIWVIMVTKLIIRLIKYVDRHRWNRQTLSSPSPNLANMSNWIDIIYDCHESSVGSAQYSVLKYWRKSVHIGFLSARGLEGRDVSSTTCGWALYASGVEELSRTANHPMTRPSVFHKISQTIGTRPTLKKRRCCDNSLDHR